MFTAQTLHKLGIDNASYLCYYETSTDKTTQIGVKMDYTAKLYSIGKDDWCTVDIQISSDSVSLVGVCGKGLKTIGSTECAYGSTYKEITAHHPELSKFFKWNGFDATDNYNLYTAYGYLNLLYGNPKQYDMTKFKQYIVYGACHDDEEELVRYFNVMTGLAAVNFDVKLTYEILCEVVQSWLDGRREELVSAFHRDRAELVQLISELD